MHENMAMVSVIKMNHGLDTHRARVEQRGRKKRQAGEEGVAEQSDVPTQGCQREVIGYEILYGLRRLTVHETKKTTVDRVMKRNQGMD